MSCIVDGIQIKMAGDTERTSATAEADTKGLPDFVSYFLICYRNSSYVAVVAMF